MAVLKEKEVCNLNSFGVSRLTKNHQYKITDSNFIPNSHINACHEILRRFIYHEKCNQGTFSMLKAIT